MDHRLRPAGSQSAPGGRRLSNNFSLDRPLFAVAFLSPPSICPSKYYSLLSRPVQRSQICYWLRNLCLLCLLEDHTALVYPRPPRSFATASISCHHNHNLCGDFRRTIQILTIEQYNIPPLSGVCAFDLPAVLRRTAIVCTVSFFQDQLADLIVDRPVPSLRVKTHTTSTHSGDNGSQAQPADPRIFHAWPQIGRREQPISTYLQSMR